MKILVSISSFFKRFPSVIVILGIFVLYTIFYSQNPSTDAWAYAYAAKSGVDLFSPHHLLYSAFGYVILKVFAFTHVEPIFLLQFFNTIFATLCLFVVRAMLRRIHKTEYFIISAVLFLGSSFGFLRFAIDNECYIIPLFFNLSALYFMQSFLMETKAYKTILMGIFLSLGCLFHQIVILTWICFAVALLFVEKKRYFLYFFLVSLSVPLVYWSVNYSISQDASLYSLYSFVLHDYLTGYAEPPQIKTILLFAPISIVRSFVQIHGYMFDIIKEYPVCSALVIGTSLLFFVYGVTRFRAIKKRDFVLFHERRFVRLVWCLMILNLLFALLSNANAEFMILIPFVVILLLSYYFNNIQFVFCFAVALLCWNTYFALLPYHKTDFNRDRNILEFVHNNSDEVYILKSKPQIENMYNYYYGENTPKLISYDRLKKEDLQELENTCVYTDVLEDKPVSRASMLGEEHKEKSFGYCFEIQDSTKNGFIPQTLHFVKVNPCLK